MKSDSLKRFIDYWQTLTPETAAHISEMYCRDATFQDPFNTVKGVPAIAHIFHDMFDRCHAPRFVVAETIMEDNRALLVWDFTFRLKSFKPDVTRKIHGTSLIRFAADGKVQSHRDYWDAAEELYEQLPIIGSVMRWLKSRMA